MPETEKSQRLKVD